MFFNSDNPVVQALTKVFDAVEAFFLGLLFCIPVVTAGASLTALHKTMMNIILEDKSSVHKTFLASFKENFKLSTQVWLTFLAIAGVLFLNFNICWGYTGSNTTMADICKAFTLVLTAAFFVVMTYTFAGIAKFNVTYKQAIKNACLYAIGKLGWSVVLLALEALFVFLAYTILWYAAFAGALISYLANKALIVAMLGKEALNKPEKDDKDGTYYE